MGSDWILLPGGFVAGIVNAVAGGGSLLTFPLFLALGYSPLVANVTNAVGVLPSNIGGVVSARAHLLSVRREVAILGSAAVVGSLIGTALLLRGGEDVFEAVVPWLLVFASALMLVRPWLSRLVAHHAGHRRFQLTIVATSLVGVYGGYFGAAMGVMFIAVLGLVANDPLKRINWVKNWLSLSVNIAGVAVICVFGPVAWSAAVWMGIGTFVGGFVGARVANNLPERAFRFAVVALALVAAIVIGLT